MIIKIMGIGIITVILSVVLKKHSPQHAIGVTVAGGAIIVALVVDDLTAVITTVRQFAEKNGISEDYIVMLTKVIGIAYLTEFTAEIAKDAGEGAVSSKIRFGGKITILTLCTPMILNLLSMITGLLP